MTDLVYKLLTSVEFLGQVSAALISINHNVLKIYPKKTKGSFDSSAPRILFISW